MWAAQVLPIHEQMPVEDGVAQAHFGVAMTTGVAPEERVRSDA